MRVEQAFIHVDVNNLRAVLNLLPRDFNRLGIVIGHDQFLKRGRASDVGAFADIDEGCGFESVAHAASTIGSSPASRVTAGGTGSARGANPFTALAIAAICAGVDPQHPPRILT